MRTHLDCIPCFIRQALEAARFVSPDPRVHEQVLHDVLQWAPRLDPHLTPPALGQRVHRRLREIIGVADPYQSVKDRHNRIALELLPHLRDLVAAAADPWVAAVRTAIAGNVIDLGVFSTLPDAAIREAADRCIGEPLAGDLDALAQRMAQAQSILYLADNAGEIVFDRPLIERLGRKVTVAVRGFPIINDATRIDADATGLSELVEVIDNGSDAPGTILDDCSPAFRDRFARADLIIAKGQGNFESLSETPGPIVFLFKAKCAVTATRAGVPVCTSVVATSLPPARP